MLSLAAVIRGGNAGPLVHEARRQHLEHLDSLLGRARTTTSSAQDTRATARASSSSAHTDLNAAAGNTDFACANRADPTAHPASAGQQGRREGLQLGSGSHTDGSTMKVKTGHRERRTGNFEKVTRALEDKQRLYDRADETCW
jgi:hypothetical protein